MISYLADPGNPDWGAGFYASIADWVAARAGLVMTEDEILECYADWPDNAPLDISGYQTNIQGFLTESGTYKAIIRPKAGAEHNGVRGAGVNIISNGITAELGNVIRLYTDAEVYGIEWRNLGTQTGIRVDSSEARVKIVGNIVTGNTGASRAANGLISLNVANGSSDCVVENNLLFEDGTSGAAIYVDRGAASNIVRNNTVYAMAGSTTEGYRRNTFGTNSEQAYNNVLLTPLGGRSGGTTSVPNTRNNGFQAGATEIVGTSNILDISRAAGVDMTDPANGDFTIAGVSSKLYDSGDVPMPLQDIAGNSYSTNDLGAFAFVAGGDVEISFTGNIADITGTQGSPITPVDVSTEFSGTLTPFTFTSVGTALPAGLTISSAGVISGTPTAGGTTSGHIVRGEDTGANTADSNAFQITITALADIEFTGSIADITGDQNQPITPVDVSANFTGDRTPFTYADTGTAWPAGIAIDTNTGIISGTPTGFGNTSGHTVTGTDTGANNAVSNAFQFLIAQELQDIEFTGSIANIAATLGSPITPVDVSGNFTGDRTPFTYAETGTVWPSWANLDVNTGIITGTPDTLGETTGHSVTGTDTGTNTAVSNLFNFNVVEADVPIDFPGNIANVSGTVGTPITPVDVSGNFTGNLTPFTYSETGTVWPTWATLDVNTGIITGTPDAAGTTSGHTVTGQDTGLNTAVSNAFSFIIGAIPDSGPAEPSLILEQVVKNKTLNSTVGFVTDPDGLAAVPFTVEPANQPTNGTLTAFNQTSGDYTYVPNTDYDGLDTFIVTVEDALGYTSPVQVDITVLVVDPYELSFGDINIALGRPENQQLNFDDPEARALAEVPSGQISISDFFGLVFPGADTRLLEPFYVGQVTMGANPINLSNEGFNSIEPAGNNYGTADTVIGIPEKPWEFQLLSEFTISGSVLRVWLVGWRDPDNNTIPNIDSSWSFIEWERTDASGDYLIYRTELQNAVFYNADPYPVTSTTWGERDLPSLPVSRGVTYEVRAYDWEYTDFDAVVGEDPTEQGYRKGDFGSMTPALTPSGVEIFEMLKVKFDTEFKISLLDPTHSLAENYFLAVQLYDPAAFTTRYTPITLKTSAAIVTRKNDATYGNYTEWSWPAASGDSLEPGASWTMRLLGMVQNTVTADELAGRQTYIGNNGESGHLFTDTSKTVSNQWTFACRFQVVDVGSNWSRLLFGLDDGVNIVGIFVNDFSTAGRTIAVSLSSNADTNSFGVSPPGVYEFDRWINLLVSVDVTKPIGERVQMYVNDTPITLDSDFTTFTAMNSPLRMWRGNTIVTTPLYVRQQSFMWFKADVALDFTIEFERRKFFSAGNSPVDLGPYGYKPTLSEPDFFVGRGDRSDLWFDPVGRQYANRGALPSVSAVGTFRTFEIYDDTYREFVMLAEEELSSGGFFTLVGYANSIFNTDNVYGSVHPEQPAPFKTWFVERLYTRDDVGAMTLWISNLPPRILARNLFTRMIIEPRSTPQTPLVFPATNFFSDPDGEGFMSWKTTFRFVDGEDYRIRFEAD